MSVPLVLLRAAAFSLVPLVSIGADPGEEMLDEFNRVLNILIYAAAALAAFSIAWAGFTAMWDSDNPSTRSRTKSAIIGAISGLLLALLAKGVMVLLIDSTTVLLPTR